MCGHFSDDRDYFIPAESYDDETVPVESSAPAAAPAQSSDNGLSRFIEAARSVGRQYRWAISGQNIVAYARNPSNSAPRGQALSPFHALARFNRAKGEPVSVVADRLNLSPGEVSKIRKAVYGQRGGGAFRKELVSALGVK